MEEIEINHIPVNLAVDKTFIVCSGNLSDQCIRLGTKDDFKSMRRICKYCKRVKDHENYLRFKEVRKVNRKAKREKLKNIATT
jgi:hypothetical protein